MGGTLDPTTGEMIWTMHVPLDAQRAHYHAHPPRALAGLRATPVEVDWAFDGHGEPVNAVFALACRCGSADLVAVGGLDEDDAVAPPISLECLACDAVFTVFDAAQHGWDGELSAVAQPVPVVFDEIETALEPPHDIVVRYEYCSDVLGDTAQPELRGREHDLFSWFTLLVRDPENGKLALAFDAECA
jgi:hypothetical protein